MNEKTKEKEKIDLSKLPIKVGIKFEFMGRKFVIRKITRKDVICRQIQ